MGPGQADDELMLDDVWHVNSYRSIYNDAVWLFI